MVRSAYLHCMQFLLLCILSAYVVCTYRPSVRFYLPIIVSRHGPHTPCPHPLTSKFILDYLSAAPDSPQRRAIERRYGRANVLKLVKQHEEEQESRKWMDLSTMACPGCEVRVEKSMGCNHVRSTLLHAFGRQTGSNPCDPFLLVSTTSLSTAYGIEHYHNRWFVPNVELISATAVVQKYRERIHTSISPRHVHLASQSCLILSRMKMSGSR